MYYVTLVHLSRDAQLADVAWGRMESIPCSPAELGVLLTAFSAIDAVENAAADPEIHVHHRRERFIVRTGQGKLLLYDARDSTQPALVLTAEEILAELDGSAKAARTVAPFVPDVPSLGEGAVAPIPSASGFEPPADLPPPRSKGLLIFSLVAAILAAAGTGYWFWQDSQLPAGLVPVPAAEAAATAQAVEGVYVTGGNPGDRGLVIDVSGAVRFFQLRADAPPISVRDTWRAARREGALCLAVTRLGTVIEIMDRNAVFYEGQRYVRTAAP